MQLTGFLCHRQEIVMFWNSGWAGWCGQGSNLLRPISFKFLKRICKKRKVYWSAISVPAGILIVFYFIISEGALMIGRYCWIILPEFYEILSWGKIWCRGFCRHFVLAWFWDLCQCFINDIERTIKSGGLIIVSNAIFRMKNNDPFAYFLMN